MAEIVAHIQSRIELFFSFSLMLNFYSSKINEDRISLNQKVRETDKLDSEVDIEG
jgi:hypothetical protein